MLKPPLVVLSASAAGAAVGEGGRSYHGMQWFGRMTSRNVFGSWFFRYLLRDYNVLRGFCWDCFMPKQKFMICWWFLTRELLQFLILQVVMGSWDWIVFLGKSFVGVMHGIVSYQHIVRISYAHGYIDTYKIIQTYRHPDTQTCWHTETGRQTDRPTYIQTYILHT